MKVKTVRLTIMMFTLLLLISACATKPYAVLSDPSCESPCWRGITMGMSIEEVMRRLNEMPDVDPSSISREISNRSPWDEYVIWRFQSKQLYGTIDFMKNKVDRLLFDGHDWLRLSEILLIYGEPEFIRLWSSGSGMIPVYITIDLLYPQQQGVCVFIEPEIFPFQVPNRVRVSPGMGVDKVYYIDASTPNSQLIGCLSGIEESQYQHEIQPWKGYGYYDFPEK